jgi:hypothetical protein
LPPGEPGLRCASLSQHPVEIPTLTNRRQHAARSKAHLTVNQRGERIQSVDDAFDAVLRDKLAGRRRRHTEGGQTLERVAVGPASSSFRLRFPTLTARHSNPDRILTSSELRRHRQPGGRRAIRGIDKALIAVATTTLRTRLTRHSRTSPIRGLEAIATGRATAAPMIWSLANVREAQP